MEQLYLSPEKTTPYNTAKYDLPEGSSKYTVMNTYSPTCTIHTPGNTLYYNGRKNKPKTSRIKHSAFRIMALAIAFVFTNLFFIQGIAQTVVTNPASPWIVPAGVTSIKVEVWGGGGAGGGCNSAFGTTYGSGGGGGASNEATFIVSPGQQYNISIGAGGTGSNDASGTAGGATTFTGAGGTVAANGGSGGARRGGSGGAGGTGGAFTGGTGGTATNQGAGGGGAAGNFGNGNNGANDASGSGGIGNPNIAPYIGGSGGPNRSSNGNGNPGNTPGGGGGGGYQGGWWNGAKAGGNGAPGQVVITYTACPAITATVSGQSNISCFAGEDGTITITASGGTGSYQFSLDNGSTYVAGSNPYTFTDLAAGTYHPRVKDANGCESPPCP